MNRRHFLDSMVLAATIPGVVGQNPGAAEAAADPSRFAEPARAVPIKDDVDVVVCGGGPAGVAAAVTAARAGARTRLIELQGCLGGIWTCGLLTWIFDFDKPGINQEIMRKLNERNARSRYSDTGVDKDFTYVPEEMKLLLEEMCQEAGAQFRLHTRVVGAYREGRRLTTAITESKSGREAWRAKVFIDATGDGDLGALAGNRWEAGLGRGQDCPCQPMTLNALGIVRDADAIQEFISFYEVNDGGEMRYGKHHRKASARLMEELHRAGVEPSYGRPSIFQIKGNLVLLMLNHEYNIPAFDADAITQATVRARAEIHRLVQGLRALGGPWEGMQMAASAEQIGVRDGRRLLGRYTVTEEDLRVGTNHADGVVGPTFNVDIHAVDKKRNDAQGPISHQDFKMQPYQIPLRALIAADVDGLMMAGRCISGDHIAHGSYRVTGNAVAMGQGAGVVAAIAAQSNRLPHEVEWAEGLAKLTQLGQWS
ncbi:MAG: FAD-dependent oxidoreductase [Candidatus Hydrogenedentes bacterium]|nr:FAD-dependent oxidoreductase [Candidatus Hydrogenedentota bacterium]